jgi:hypothetical protein
MTIPSSNGLVSRENPATADEDGTGGAPRRANSTFLTRLEGYRRVSVGWGQRDRFKRSDVPSAIAQNHRLSVGLGAG